MTDRRWAWLLVVVLLLGAAVSSMRAVGLWWSPCPAWFGPGYSDGCLARMENGWPFAPQLGVPGTQRAVAMASLAQLLAAAAWAVVAVTLTRRWRPRLMMATLSLALGAVAVTRLRGIDAGWIPWLVDAGAVLALIGMVRSAPVGWRAPAVWVSVAGFGWIGSAVAYLAMGLISPATWDIPPGTGVMSAALFVVVAPVVLPWPTGQREARTVTVDSAISEATAGSS